MSGICNFPKYITGLKAEKTTGKIIDVNVSFQDQLGDFYHGAFVVVSTEGSIMTGPPEPSHISAAALATNSKHFALPCNNGAAVVDKQSGIVLGLVVATLENYTPHLKNVTFCLRLNYALDSLNEIFTLRIGSFRTFET